MLVGNHLWDSDQKKKKKEYGYATPILIFFVVKYT